MTLTLVCLIALAGCGDGDTGLPPPDGPKVAYVVTECRAAPEGLSLRQELRIQQWDGSYVVVAEVAPDGPLPGSPRLCGLWAWWGLQFVAVGAFQRLGMSPDGSLVVFEVTDDHSVIGPDSLVDADQEGIFVVRADGSGLRRLGDASSNPCFSVLWTGNVDPWPWFFFNRDGSSVTFTDIGPGPSGDAVQIFTMDVATGRRQQVTQLPPMSGVPAGFVLTGGPSFLDANTISFFSFANPVIAGDALNPDHERRLFSVKTTVTTDNPDNPTQLHVVPFFAEPGNAKKIIEAFQITGREPIARMLTVPGYPVDGCGWFGCIIREVFVLDGKRALQLTNFRRQSTKLATMSADRKRVFFSANADPLGSNPFNANQIFSIDRLGGDLRQLTSFSNEQRRIPVMTGHALAAGWLLFSSSHNPFGLQTGVEPNSIVQVFAMRPDGTGLRQLTRTAGKVVGPDGTVTVEVLGPWISSGVQH
jgi:hypothetical protein